MLKKITFSVPSFNHPPFYYVVLMLRTFLLIVWVVGIQWNLLLCFFFKSDIICMLLVCLQRSVLEYYCIKNSYKVQGIRIYTSLLK